MQNARHLARMIMIIARLHMITAVVNAGSRKGKLLRARVVSFALMFSFLTFSITAM